MSYPGLLCVIIKSANDAQPELGTSVLGSGLAGALLGGGAGALGGGLHGYFMQPQEIDPMTGEPKSKWDNVWKGMGYGGAIGAGIGGLAGGHAGWRNKTQGWEYGKDMMDKYAPGKWEEYVQNWQTPNAAKLFNAESAK